MRRRAGLPQDQSGEGGSLMVFLARFPCWGLRSLELAPSQSPAGWAEMVIMMAVLSAYSMPGMVKQSV